MIDFGKWLPKFLSAEDRASIVNHLNENLSKIKAELLKDSFASEESIARIITKSFREMGMGEVLSNPCWNSVGLVYKIANALVGTVGKGEMVNVDYKEEAQSLAKKVIELSNEITCLRASLAKTDGVEEEDTLARKINYTEAISEWAEDNGFETSPEMEVELAKRIATALRRAKE